MLFSQVLLTALRSAVAAPLREWQATALAIASPCGLWRCVARVRAPGAQGSVPLMRTGHGVFDVHPLFVAGALVRALASCLAGDPPGGRGGIEPCVLPCAGLSIGACKHAPVPAWSVGGRTFDWHECRQARGCAAEQRLEPQAMRLQVSLCRGRACRQGVLPPPAAHTTPCGGWYAAERAAGGQGGNMCS